MSDRPVQSPRAPLPNVFLAVCAALLCAWWLAPVLVPVSIAWLGKIALTGPTRRLRRLGLPAPVAAGGLMISIVAALVLGAYALVVPASNWIERLPEELTLLEERWREVRRPVEDLAKIGETVDELVRDDPDVLEDEPVPVSIEDPRPKALQIVDVAGSALAQVVLVVVLLFFLLATDQVLLDKWRSLADSSEERERADAIARAVEAECSRYLVSITLINLALGACVGLVCWACGLPNAALWGAVAAFLNYVPFLGAIVGFVLVAIVGLATMPTLGAALLPAACYLAINTLEGWVVTPAIVGRRIRLSPVAILVWLMVWGWLWGLAGAILAVPMLATFVIVCREVPQWRAVATLMEA